MSESASKAGCVSRDSATSSSTEDNRCSCGICWKIGASNCDHQISITVTLASDFSRIINICVVTVCIGTGSLKFVKNHLDLRHSDTGEEHLSWDWLEEEIRTAFNDRRLAQGQVVASKLVSHVVIGRLNSALRHVAQPVVELDLETPEILPIGTLAIISRILSDAIVTDDSRGQERYFFRHVIGDSLSVPPPSQVVCGFNFTSVRVLALNSEVATERGR